MTFQRTPFTGIAGKCEEGFVGRKIAEGQKVKGWEMGHENHRGMGTGCATTLSIREGDR